MSLTQGLSLDQLDFRGRAEYDVRRREILASHEAYLREHVEYREVLHECMQALLVHKPSDPLHFVKQYFTDHRERR